MGLGLAEVETAIGALGRLGASSPVTIGGMVLTGLEVPGELTIGGEQVLVVHRLLGGGRIVDALGNDPDRLTLTGRFVGPEAQARAQTLERMRRAGVPVAFSAAGLSCSVWVAQFRYAYQAKGAVCAYSLVLERPTEVVSVSASQDVASGIGTDIASASALIGGLSSGIYTLAGQVGTLVGQVTPLTALLGAGGAVMSVTNALGVVDGVAQTGVDLAGSPAAVTSMMTGLTQAGSGLTTVLDQTGANLEGITLSGSNGLSVLTQNAGLASAAADAGGLVNRALANVALAGGMVSPAPVVSA